MAHNGKKKNHNLSDCWDTFCFQVWGTWTALPVSPIKQAGFLSCCQQKLALFYTRTHYLAWFSCNDKHCRIKFPKGFLALRVILPGVLCTYSAFWELCQGTEVFYCLIKATEVSACASVQPRAHVDGAEVGCHLTPSSSWVHYLQAVAKLALYFCLTPRCSPAP